jgi:hypothetical protein
MSSALALTIILAAVVMAIVIAGLAIGLILTGKSRLRRGCGLAPKRGAPGKEGETTCSICGDKRVCPPEEEDESSGGKPD